HQSYVSRLHFHSCSPVLISDIQGSFHFLRVMRRLTRYRTLSLCLERFVGNGFTSSSACFVQRVWISLFLSMGTSTSGSQAEHFMHLTMNYTIGLSSQHIRYAICINPSLHTHKNIVVGYRNEGPVYWFQNKVVKS